MAYEFSIQRYRHWYSELLRLYPAPYQERFAEGMEQVFTDLCRERVASQRGLFRFTLWMFIETFVGALKENLTFITMQHITKRLVTWAIAVALLLMIPLVLTLLGSGVDGDGWHWTFFDFVFMGTLLFGAATTYELVARKMKNGEYRFAVGMAVVTGVLLVWINAAVGIIGDGPVNILYFVVLAIGFLGAIQARFQPRGMSRVLFVIAALQALVPVIASVAFKPDFSPGVLEVFALNSIFAVLWAGSGLLFRRASGATK